MADTTEKCPHTVAVRPATKGYRKVVEIIGADGVQVHVAASWEMAALHFAFAMDEIEALRIKNARLKAIVNGLPRHKDGPVFATYEPAAGTVAWCLWAKIGETDWRVSTCHRPVLPSELVLGCSWIVDARKEQCAFRGPYSTRAAAEAALAKRDGE